MAEIIRNEAKIVCQLLYKFLCGFHMPKSSCPGGWVGGWLGGWLEKLGIKLTRPSLVELGLGLSLEI